MTSFLKRIVRAARLDSRLYEEVEADQNAFGQALAVVLASSLAMMVSVTGRFSPSELLSGLILGILGWALWSAVAYLVGARLCPEPQTRADWGELLRTTGFAAAPGILAILGVVSVFSGFITFLASIWMLLAFTVAVRQALDYRSTVRAVAVCFAAWLLYAGMFLGLVSRA